VRRRYLPLTLVPLGLLASACEHGGEASRPTPPSAPLTPSSGSGTPLDPASCSPCHAGHVTAWSGSMHAYASDDPVFRAMNARAQRDTKGALGNFCLQCHAPLAAAASQGKLVDPASLPLPLRGVGCTFCHGVDATTELHDGALRLAGDGAFRAALESPLATTSHASAYSSLHDRTRPEAATLCGACHDVRMPNGADLERTFAEWTTTVFAQPGPDAKTCGGCHMPGSQGLAATVPGAPVRTVHDHAMAALDTALVPFPEAAAQRKAVQLSLDSALVGKLCVQASAAAAAVQVSLLNARIGHAWPTGATHDRRAWVELRAFAGGTEVWSRGAAPGDAPPDPAVTPDAILLGGTLVDDHERPVKFLWEATGTHTRVLAPRTLNLPGVPVPLTERYVVPTAGVDRVTMRVRVTPFAPDVLDALVTSGDLDAKTRAAVPVFSLASTTLEWTKDRGDACLP
jgi:hypothetical protein